MTTQLPIDQLDEVLVDRNFDFAKASERLVLFVIAHGMTTFSLKEVEKVLREVANVPN